MYKMVGSSLILLMFGIVWSLHIKHSVDKIAWISWLLECKQC